MDTYTFLSVANKVGPSEDVLNTMIGDENSLKGYNKIKIVKKYKCLLYNFNGTCCKS